MRSAVARILLRALMPFRTPAFLLAALLAAEASGLEPYVSAQLGFASSEWPRGAPLNGRIDDRAAALGVDVGIAFARYWAIELGVYDYGAFDATGTPCAAGASCPPLVTDITGTDITIAKAAIVPRFSIGRVRLFAPFGYYRARIDSNLDLPSSKSRDRGALLGVGARWYFRDPWSVSLQATRFDDNLAQLMFGVGWGLRDEDDKDGERDEPQR
jgi:hypothetical protein